MFAKPYLDEVLAERRATSERSAAQIKRGRNEFEEEMYEDYGAYRFRNEETRRRQKSVEQTVEKDRIENIADKYFENKHWNLLGQLESGEKYDKHNSEGGGIGALGKYQMRKGILTDLGYVNNKGVWQGKDGIYSSSDFLDLPEVQEKIARKMVDTYYKQLRGYMDNVGAEIAGKKSDFKITERGLIAAAHRMGQGNVKKYLNLLEKNKDGLYYFPYSKFKGSERTKYEAIETRLRLFSE